MGGLLRATNRPTLPSAPAPGCSAVLAHYLLNEKLNAFGVVGCLLCISGSLAIVLHAPEERPIASVLQVWTLATQPGGGAPHAAAPPTCPPPPACRHAPVQRPPGAGGKPGAPHPQPSLPGPRPPCRPALPAPLRAGFLLYVCVALAATMYLIFGVSLEVQAGNILVYVAICSIVGSLSGGWVGQACGAGVWMC